jgi:hypothetical protein
VSHGSGPRLPVEVGSGAATCPMAPGSASLRGELRRCHVFLGSGPRLPAEVSSDAATWPDLASPRGELWCCHVPHDPSGLWITGIKKGLTAPGTYLSSHVSKARLRVTDAPARHPDMPLQFGSTVAAHAQLTTPKHDYSGDTTRQDSTTTLTMFSIAG